MQDNKAIVDNKNYEIVAKSENYPNDGCLYFLFQLMIQDPYYFIPKNIPLYSGEWKFSVENGYREDFSETLFDLPEGGSRRNNVKMIFEDGKLYIRYLRGQFNWTIYIEMLNGEMDFFADGTFIGCELWDEECEMCKNTTEDNYDSECPRCKQETIKEPEDCPKYCNKCEWNSSGFNCSQVLNVTCSGIIDNDGILRFNNLNNTASSMNLWDKFLDRFSYPILDDYICKILDYMKDKLNSQYPEELNEIIMDYIG